MGVGNFRGPVTYPKEKLQQPSSHSSGWNKEQASTSVLETDLTGNVVLHNMSQLLDHLSACSL